MSFPIEIYLLGSNFDIDGYVLLNIAVKDAHPQVQVKKWEFSLLNWGHFNFPFTLLLLHTLTPLCFIVYIEGNVQF